MDVPQEEPEEELEEEQEDWEEDPGRGTRKRKEKRKREEQEEEIRIGLSNIRYVSRCIIEETSLTFYWIIQLLFTDGWKMEDWEDGSWE